MERLRPAEPARATFISREFQRRSFGRLRRQRNCGDAKRAKLAARMAIDDPKKRPSCSIARRCRAYSVAPTDFDILKPSDFEAGMFSASPVLGLRPSRAGRSLTENRPNPAMATSSPRLAASMIAARIEVTTSFALALEMSLASATASTSSVVFIGLLQRLGENCDQRDAAHRRARGVM